MAHKWADWLRHPRHLGGPQHRNAGDKTRSGPQVGQDWLHHPCRLGGPQSLRARQKQQWPTSGRIAYITPAVWGSPTPQSQGQNQKWPTSGQIGRGNPAVWGVPNTPKRGSKSTVAHKWADWLRPPPLCLGGPQCFTARDTTNSGPQVGSLATYPLPSWGPQRFQAGDTVSTGPQVGGLASSAVPFGGSPTPQSRVQNP